MTHTQQAQPAQTNSFHRGRIVLMCFGLGGNSYHYENPNMTGSWYARPAELDRLITQGHYSAAEMEGAILIDKIPALEAEGGYSHAFNSPMVKTNLRPGERDGFEPKLQAAAPFAAMLVSEVPQFATLVAGHLAHDASKGPGPLDDVSVDEYVQWWRERGARIGRVESGRAVWA